MTTAVKKRAIPPPRDKANFATTQALAVAVGELSGSVGSNLQRAVRVCELLDAGLLHLQTDGSLGSVAPGVKVFNDGAKITIQNEQDGGPGRGIYWWHSADTDWVSYMAQAGAGRAPDGGTACAALNGSTDYHVRTRVAALATQGALWENENNLCLMSLDGANGYLHVRGRVLSGLGYFSATGTFAVLSSETGGLGLFLRPNGWSSDTGAVRILNSGFMGVGGVTPEQMLDVNGRMRLRHNATYNTPGTWYQISTGTDKWFWGVKDNGNFGLYNTTNTWVWHLADDGRPAIKNANSTTMITQPRTFVQAADPGAAAADGDLWAWSGGLKRRSAGAWVVV